jgi:acyl-CoA dehydrogenase
MVFPFGRSESLLSDKLVHQASAILLTESATRDRLTQGIFINDNPDDATGRIEVAFKAVLAAAPVEAKIRTAQKQKTLAKGNPATLIKDALTKNIITEHEATLLTSAEHARLAAITVDDFSPGELNVSELINQHIQ